MFFYLKLYGVSLILLVKCLTTSSDIVSFFYSIYYLSQHFAYLFLLEELLSTFLAMQVDSWRTPFPFMSGAGFISPSYLKNNFAWLSILS